MNEKKIAKGLSSFLADSYVLYLKTQNFHWNVEGEGFYFLHKMFQEQYEDLAEAVDLIAERIRGLKLKSPGSMKEFLELSRIKEALGSEGSSDMILKLTEDHEKIIESLRSLINEAASEHDEGTVDMYVERLRVHEKTAWMLRSHLQN